MRLQPPTPRPQIVADEVTVGGETYPAVYYQPASGRLRRRHPWGLVTVRGADHGAPTAFMRKRGGQLG